MAEKINSIAFRLTVHKKDINKCVLWNGNIPGTFNKQKYGNPEQDARPDSWYASAKRTVKVPVGIKKECTVDGVKTTEYEQAFVTFTPSSGGAGLGENGAGWDGWHYTFDSSPATVGGASCGCNQSIDDRGCAWEHGWDRKSHSSTDDRKVWGGAARFAATSGAFWDQNYATNANTYGDPFNGGSDPALRIPLGWNGGVNSVGLSMTVQRTPNDEPCDGTETPETTTSDVTYVPFIPKEWKWPVPLPVDPNPNPPIDPGTTVYYPWRPYEICVTTTETASAEDVKKPYLGTYKKVDDNLYTSAAGTAGGGRTVGATVSYSDVSIPTFHISFPGGATADQSEADVNAFIAANVDFDNEYVVNRTGIIGDTDGAGTPSPVVTFDVPAGSEQVQVHHNHHDKSAATCLIDSNGHVVDPVSGDPGCVEPSPPDHSIEKIDGTWTILNKAGIAQTTAGTGDSPTLSDPFEVKDESCEWNTSPLRVCYWETTDDTPSDVSLDPSQWPVDRSGGPNHGQVFPPPELNLVPAAVGSDDGNCWRDETVPVTDPKYPYPVGACIKVPGLEGLWYVIDYVKESGTPPFPGWGTHELERTTKKDNFLSTLRGGTTEIYIGGSADTRQTASDDGVAVPNYKTPLQFLGTEDLGVMNTSGGYDGAPSILIKKDNTETWEMYDNSGNSLLDQKIEYLDYKLTGDGWKYEKKEAYIVGFGFESSMAEGAGSDAPSKVIISDTEGGTSSQSLPLWDFDDNQASKPWTTSDSFFNNYLGGSYANNYDVSSIVSGMDAETVANGKTYESFDQAALDASNTASDAYDKIVQLSEKDKYDLQTIGAVGAKGPEGPLDTEDPWKPAPHPVSEYDGPHPCDDKTNPGQVKIVVVYNNALSQSQNIAEGTFKLHQDFCKYSHESGEHGGWQINMPDYDSDSDSTGKWKITNNSGTYVVATSDTGSLLGGYIPSSSVGQVVHSITVTGERLPEGEGVREEVVRNDIVWAAWHDQDPSWGVDFQRVNPKTGEVLPPDTKSVIEKTTEYVKVALKNIEAGIPDSINSNLPATTPAINSKSAKTYARLEKMLEEGKNVELALALTSAMMTEASARDMAYALNRIPTHIATWMGGLDPEIGAEIRNFRRVLSRLANWHEKKRRESTR